MKEIKTAFQKVKEDINETRSDLRSEFYVETKKYEKKFKQMNCIITQLADRIENLENSGKESVLEDEKRAEARAEEMDLEQAREKDYEEKHQFDKE